MPKTFVQIWFTAETETISRPGRFVVVEVNKTFDQLCIDIENNAFITGDTVHTARVNAETYRIFSRYQTGFRGSAVARCQIAGGTYLETEAA